MYLGINKISDSFKNNLLLFQSEKRNKIILVEM